MSLWESNLFVVGNWCCIYSWGNPPFLESMGVRQSPYIILSIQEKAFLKGFLNFQVKGHYGSFYVLHTHCSWIWMCMAGTSYEERQRMLGLAMPGEEEAQRGPHCSLQPPEEGKCFLRRCWPLLPGHRCQDVWGWPKLCQGGSDWTSGKMFVLGGWANTGTGFLERSFGTTLSIVCSNFWCGQAVVLNDLCRSLPAELFLP